MVIQFIPDAIKFKCKENRQDMLGTIHPKIEMDAEDAHNTLANNDIYAARCKRRRMDNGSPIIMM